MGKINKSYLKDKFTNKAISQEGSEITTDNGSYWPNNPVKNYTGGNSLLAPGGTKKVQDYQRYLNDTYNLYLAEDGAWGPKTQKAYEQFVLNKETPVYTPVSRAFADNRKFYTVNEKGEVMKGKNSFPRLKPTLEEFKAVYESLPGYNYGYESLTDSDPKTIGVQTGPLSPERTKQLAEMSSEQELRNMYLGKAFGTLPVFENSGVYAGYSPYRMWTGSTPYFRNDTRLQDLSYLEEHPRYMYIMAPREGTQAKKIQDEAIKRTNYDYLEKNPKLLEDSVRKTFKYYDILDASDYLKQSQKDFLTYAKSLKSEDYTKPEVLQKLREYKNNFLRTSPQANLPYTQPTWQAGERMATEFLANPEIVEYAKEHNIDLNTDTTFTSQLGEAVDTRRRALFYNEPLGTNSQSVAVNIVQDPEQFSFVGYLPVTPDMLTPYSTTNGDYYDFKWTPELFEKAGVPENLRDLQNLYITTSAFPLQEYKPRKDAQGNIYKKGGQVKSKLKTSYKNKRG